jgi:YD repeat-containing protein
VTEKTFQRENPAWQEKTRYSVPRHVYDPSGRLTLILDDDSYRWEFDCVRKWSDAKGRVVEEHIDDAISSVREALQSKRQTRIRIEEERQREIERQRVRAEEIRQEREEEQRFEGLKRLAGAWSQCEQLRGFIAAWEHATEAKNGPISPGSPEDGWRRWVNGLIDKIDPLVEAIPGSNSLPLGDPQRV